MKNIIQIQKQLCPFCNIEHNVEYVADCLIQYTDGSRLKIYKCPITNKDFRIHEK